MQRAHQAHPTLGSAEHQLGDYFPRHPTNNRSQRHRRPWSRPPQRDRQAAPNQTRKCRFRGESGLFTHGTKTSAATCGDTAPAHGQPPAPGWTSSEKGATVCRLPLCRPGNCGCPGFRSPQCGPRGRCLCAAGVAADPGRQHCRQHPRLSRLVHANAVRRAGPGLCGRLAAVLGPRAEAGGRAADPRGRTRGKSTEESPGPEKWVSDSPVAEKWASGSDSPAPIPASEKWVSGAASRATRADTSPGRRSVSLSAP